MEQGVNSFIVDKKGTRTVVIIFNFEQISQIAPVFP